MPAERRWDFKSHQWLLARHQAFLLYILIAAGKFDGASAERAKARRMADRSGDVEATFTVKLAEVPFAYVNGRFSDALTLIDSIMRSTTETSRH